MSTTMTLYPTTEQFPGDSEYYTPPNIMEAVRAVLGEIDLDPASCEAANQIVGAARFYTDTDDGLSLPWHGRVYCNPPGGKRGNESRQGLFWEKLVNEYEAGRVEAAVFLGFNLDILQVGQRSTVAPQRFPHVVLARRLSFLRPGPDGVRAERGSPDPSVVFLLTRDRGLLERFRLAFGRFGVVTVPAGTETAYTEAAPPPPRFQAGDAEAIFRLTPEDREMLDVLEEKMNLVRARVRSVAQGRTPGLFVHGTGGIGKSFCVLGELDRIKAEYRLHNGQITGRGLYDALANAPEAVHVLEDLESMYGNKQVQNLLRSTCWGQERDGRMHRPMSWQCKNAPAPFVFEGGVVILSNRPLSDIPELQAVATRLNPVELHVTDREVAALMRSVALEGHKHGAECLTPDQCSEVAEFVIREALEAGRSLDMRLLKNAFNDRLQFESGDRVVHWHDLVRSRMQGRVVIARREGRAERVSREREIALSIAGLPRVERAAKWTELTGLSEKALYRRLAG